MSNWRCVLGDHDWKMVGIIQPIKSNSEFNLSYLGHVAMGECTRCGKQELRELSGTFTWYKHDEVTRAEYREKFDTGEFRR